MSQAPVKWVYPEWLDECNRKDKIPVVPLSALREVVEGLKMIADGTHNQLSEWLIVRRENVIDVGEANKSSAKSLVAQRLLASLMGNKRNPRETCHCLDEGGNIHFCDKER